jgi:uncharacterized membrane protein
MQLLKIAFFGFLMLVGLGLLIIGLNHMFYMSSLGDMKAIDLVVIFGGGYAFTNGMAIIMNALSDWRSERYFRRIMRGEKARFPF